MIISDGAEFPVTHLLLQWVLGQQKVTMARAASGTAAIESDIQSKWKNAAVRLACDISLRQANNIRAKHRLFVSTVLRSPPRLFSEKQGQIASARWRALDSVL